MVDEFRLPFVNFRARVTLEEPPIRPDSHVQPKLPMRTSAIRGPRDFGDFQSESAAFDTKALGSVICQSLRSLPLQFVRMPPRILLQPSLRALTGKYYLVAPPS